MSYQRPCGHCRRPMQLVGGVWRCLYGSGPTRCAWYWTAQ